jgi:hypothetical protein
LRNPYLAKLAGKIYLMNSQFDKVGYIQKFHIRDCSNNDKYEKKLIAFFDTQKSLEFAKKIFLPLAENIAYTTRFFSDLHNAVIG